MSEIDITKLNISELKALAYDEVVKIDGARANLNVINQRILEIQNKPIKEVSNDENKQV